MNKLKKKVFITILAILSVSLLSFIVLFNVQNYLEKKQNIERNLSMNYKVPKEFENKEHNKFSDIDENIRFMDLDVYNVIVEEGVVKEVVNHSNKNITNSEITNIANEILKSNIKKKYIGFLYISKYSYAFNGNNLTIIDNSNTRSFLTNRLLFSIVIFILLELAIIYITNLITNWIIEPVRISFEKQRQFIADASHELKTPLAVIMASGEALENNPKETKWLKNINNESSRMNELIKDLLELASTENETLELNNGNLSKVTELSILTFEGKAFEKNIKLDYDIESNIMFKMNENSIKQVIEILLDNAIKHSKEKETVKIILKEHSNNIELLVQNKGDAIPKGEEEKIFERFYRVDKARSRKENRYGLGLAIAKNIIEKHKGSISASSNNGVTTFKILLKK